MKLDKLRDAWRIVLVATPETAGGLSGTLEDVRIRSVSARIEILAVDHPAVREQLAGVASPVRYALPETPRDRSYWTGLLSCFAMPEEPVIFLLAGCRVPAHWDARLVAAAQRSGAAAVAPLCVRHPVLSVLRDRRRPPGLSVDEMDQWLNDYAIGGEFPVPFMLQSCLVLQGDHWGEAAPGCANDEQLVARLRHRGEDLVATDQLYIDDFHTDCDTRLDFLSRPYRDAWLDRSPIAGLRHALSELAERREAPPELRDCLPVQLHVGHSWGGGLARWMEDYIAADVTHHHLVLRSIGDLSAFGQSIALYRSARMDVPLKTWTLCEPVLSVSAGSLEYRRILEELVQQFSVESLVVSSLIGHTLDLLQTPLPTTVVMHEFFPFCPALYATYDAPCQSCGPERLRSCFENNPKNAYFHFDTDDHWFAIRALFAERVGRDSVALVAPSTSVVERYRALEPRLRDKPIQVVPHGLDESLLASLASCGSAGRAGAAQSGGPLKIVVLGRLSQEKGGEILAAACGQIAKFAEIWLLGTGESGEAFRSLPGVTVVPHYDSGELGERLRWIGPHLGLQLSTVPESFSYTLSELWAAGIPVMASRIGALEERIEDGITGWLIEPDAAALVSRLRALDNDRQQVAEVAGRVAEREPLSARAMVDEYAAVAPQMEDIPLLRYYLPRRTYRNPYAAGTPDDSQQALIINPHRPYRQALQEFVRHTERKLEQTPALPRWAARGARRLLRVVAGMVGRRDA